MRSIYRYLLEYQRKHFDWKVYLTVGLFLVVCFVFNYTFDFEDSYIDQFRGTFWHWLSFLIWMPFPFVVISLMLKKLGKDVQLNQNYWLMVLIGFSILAFDRAYNGYEACLTPMTMVNRVFISKCLFWCSSLLTNVLPLILVYIIFMDEQPKNYFGLSRKRFNPKPYFILLAIAVIFIGLGSFLGDLQAYYPRYQFSRGDQFAEANNLPHWLTLLIYEISYASDFVSVELFFRGFLIFAFARTLGGYAVLAMVGSYAFLHFGKPMSEAISSIFGGYLLGIVSYNTRSVWGGIIIHIGVAWAMELFGYLQKLI